MDEERGVLGNLPRTRPGTRSARRAPKPGRGSSRPAAETPAKAEEDARRDLLGEGVRLAGSGLRVADALARELLRRLPRP